MRQKLFIFCLSALSFLLVSNSSVLAVHKKTPEQGGCISTHYFPYDDAPDPFFIFKVPCELDDLFSLETLRRVIDGQTRGQRDSCGASVATHTSERCKFKINDILSGYADGILREKCIGGTVIKNWWANLENPDRIVEHNDCLPITSIMQFCVNNVCTDEKKRIGGDPQGDIIVSAPGSFKLKWWIDNPSPSLNPIQSCSTKGPTEHGIQRSDTSGEANLSGIKRGIYEYDFTCSGILSGSASAESGSVVKKLFVNVGNIKPPQIESFTVSPEQVEKGESAVLSWTSTDVTSLSIDNNIGIVTAPSGSSKVTPGVSTPYTLTATGEFASVKASVKLTVVEPLPPAVTFIAEPARIKKGEKIKLIWATEKAKSVTIRERVGVVDLGGTRDLPLSGEIELIPRGEGEIFYTLEAIGKSPDLITAKTIPVHVIISQAPIVTLVAEPARIKKGESVKLKWQTTNAKSVSIEGIGKKEPVDSGFVLVRPEATTEYKIIAEGLYPELGKTEAKARVEVVSGKEPIVSISVQPDTIKPGEKATLRWDSSNAKSIRIEPTVGSVREEGSIRVSPRITTTYIITAAGTDPLFRPTRSSVTVKVESPDGKPVELPLEVPPEAPIIEEPEVPEPPEVDLKINGQDQDLTMEAPASFTLSWNLNKYCLAYGSWIGIKTKAGEERRTESKPGTYTYKLYCPGIGSDAVTVQVVGKESVGAGRGVIGVPAVPMPIAEASISLDGKIFSRSIRVIRGKPVKLWLSAAYDTDGDRRASRDDSGSWTSAFSLGGRCEWNSDLNQGAPTFESATFDPQDKEECTIPLGELTFFDKPGTYHYGVLQLVQNDGKVSGIGYINVAVQEPPPPDTPPVVDLRINNSDKEQIAIGAPAEYVVSWDVRNADTCKASGSWAGDKFLTGAERFVASFKKELTYTLTCVGKLGTTEKTILLKVAELPVCEFSALPAVLDKQSVFDRQSALSWKCRFANSCYISPSTGASNAVFGSVRVRPTATTNYTLTCENLDGSSSFGASVEVK